MPYPSSHSPAALGPTLARRIRNVALTLGALAAGACSSNGGASDAGAAAPTAGAAATIAAAGSNAAAGGGTATAGTTGQRGTPGATAGAGAGGPAAGSSGTGTAGSMSTTLQDAGTPDAQTAQSQDAGPPRPTECDGKPLPPRALAAVPPFSIGPAAAGLQEYWPTDAWRSEAPDKLGFDAQKLMTAVDYKTQYSNTQAVFIVRHGYVAAEKYSGGFAATTQHESYSVAKSFTSGLIGIAIGEGKLSSVDEKICMYYPMQWDCSDSSDPRSRITIANAMNLATGLQWHEDWRSTATGVNDAFNLNLLDTVLSRPSAEEPGTRQRYSTGDPALLSGVLQQATGMTAYEYAKQKVFDVIGIPGVRWNSDTQGRTTTYAGLQATAAEYAKYGYLYLQRGLWDGMQVIPSDWIDRTTQAQDLCHDWYSYLWHINPTVRLGTQPDSCDELFCQPTEFADLPADGYFAAGVNGQFIFVVPSADLVIVRLANDMAGSEHWDDYARGLLSAVLDAIE